MDVAGVVDERSTGDAKLMGCVQRFYRIEGTGFAITDLVSLEKGRK